MIERRYFNKAGAEGKSRPRTRMCRSVELQRPELKARSTEGLGVEFNIQRWVKNFTHSHYWLRLHRLHEQRSCQSSWQTLILYKEIELFVAKFHNYISDHWVTVVPGGLVISLYSYGLSYAKSRRIIPQRPDVHRLDPPSIRGSEVEVA